MLTHKKYRMLYQCLRNIVRATLKGCIQTMIRSEQALQRVATTVWRALSARELTEPMAARRYAQPSESEAAKKVFDGRTFDGNRISARYVSEEDLRQAQTGGWNPGTNGSLPPPPGALSALLQQPTVSSRL